MNEKKNADKFLQHFATDGKFILIELCETDKENYYRLLEQTNEIPGFYDRSEHYELMWKVAMDSGEINYSIYNNLEEYCGNILIRNPKSITPEIGIDLLSDKRNQGIAAACIKLLARSIHKERSDVDYFILRVSSNNLHSKHMIEKLGAIYVGEEDTLYKRFLKYIVKERIEECNNPERKNKLDALLSQMGDEDDEVVYRYKLMPSVYLRKNEYD